MMQLMENCKDSNLSLHCLKTAGAPVLKLILRLLLPKDLFDLCLLLHLLVLVLLVLLPRSRTGRSSSRRVVSRSFLLRHNWIPESCGRYHCRCALATVARTPGPA